MIKNRTIFTADNLLIMRGMDSESIDLIYLDPPFNSNRNYAAPVGSKAAGAEFQDTWTLDEMDDAWLGEIAEKHTALHNVIVAAGSVGGDGDKAYCIYMAIRLLEMHRLLKSTGSLYLHCDPTMSHPLKLVLDAIFGEKNFRNEIIWNYKSGGASKKQFSRKHDVLLFYSKSNKYCFTPLKERSYTKSKTRKAGLVQYGQGKSAVFHEDEKGVYTDINMRDVWDISYISSTAKERTGYPTQKPLALLERVIRASSKDGDWILDPFCGCATTAVAAEIVQNRNWIGIDVSKRTFTLINERLYNELGWSGGTDITSRTDAPKRENMVKRSSDVKDKLFATQRAICNGCHMEFSYRNLVIDHVVPRARGGQDDDSNLQLLCGWCNSVKGARPMEYLITRLKEAGLRK